MGKISDAIHRGPRTAFGTFVTQWLQPLAGLITLGVLGWYLKITDDLIRENYRTNHQQALQIQALQASDEAFGYRLKLGADADNQLKEMFNSLLPEKPRYGQDDADRDRLLNEREREVLEKRLRQYTDEQCSKC